MTSKQQPDLPTSLLIGKHERPAPPGARAFPSPTPETLSTINSAALPADYVARNTMALNAKWERVEAALNGGPFDRVPFTLWMH
jgi:predicted nucleotidyltransferase